MMWSETPKAGFLGLIEGVMKNATLTIRPSTDLSSIIFSKY